MSLPLLRRTGEHDARFFLSPGVRTGSTPARALAPDAAARMPMRLPRLGEQYRFHVDMERCIGCKCCVVACNEQNGNPASITWRRVGEIEGGFFPTAIRSYLSMGCNHCLEPTCLSGCPVDAYSKDPVTGIVRHSADACIGCQYCTWNCAYGVPQYNAERGVVGKCDMCYGRLEHSQEPACVSACPEGAIAIELVNMAAWKAATATSAPGRGLPASDGSLSTTRVTIPPNLPPNSRPVDLSHVTAEQAHWSLVAMTVMTQASVGAFVVIWLLQLMGEATRLGAAAVTALLVAALALGGATLHLGRPVYAYRALRMWRRSWLSREVALFGAFSGVAGVYAAALWLEFPGASWLGGLTSLIGAAGITASACIYRVPSRPAWNTRFTLLQFNLTGAALGPLLVLGIGASAARELAFAAAAMAGAQLILTALHFVRLVAADSVELNGTARLLSTTFKPHLLARGLLLAGGGVVLPLVATASAPVWAAFALALSGEVVGRYLFFVSVVPKHMATPYLELGSEAA